MSEVLQNIDTGEEFPIKGMRFTADVFPGTDISYAVDTGYDTSAYWVEDNRIAINDAVWGKMSIGAEPGDEVFLDIVNHPLIRRLHAIEQLTLPRSMTTIAGTSDFSRWEHVWGSVVLTRKLSNNLDISDEEKRKLELRTLLSDSAHWAFSHLGDWILQGAGGAEDAHDDHQLELINKTGMSELLEGHGYSAEELLVKSDHNDWVECPSPDLNIDRVDYGVRESMRWIGGYSLKTHINRLPFEVNQDDQLIMTDMESARQFTKAYMLLSSEHWAEPVHRLQLRILEEMVKYSLIHYEPSSMRPLINWGPYHPRDMLMSIDYDFEASHHTSMPFMWALHDIASNVGREKRLIFRTMRASFLMDFISNNSETEFPDPLVGGRPHFNRHSLSPSNVEIVPLEEDQGVGDFESNPNLLDFYLPELKMRSINPLVDTPQGPKRLGNLDENVSQLIEQHKQIVSRRYLARIALNSDFMSIVSEGIKDNQQNWVGHLKYPRMDDETFRGVFENVSELAVAVRKTDLEWFR